MGITRFKLNEDPSPVIGKADFEWFYSGTLQTGDDNKIPVKTKIIDVYINRLDVILYSAATGDVTGGRVLVSFYKNGVLLGQVVVAASATSGTLVIAKTLVTAGDLMTVEIDQVGNGAYGVTMSAYARVTAS
jgi:hypothetical protein